jgi:riboflavin synthase
VAPEENGVDAMFTGIVEELGEVVALEELGDAARLTVRGPLVTAGASAGDSIAINGVCLTVTDASDGTFSADVMGETLSRSGLGALGAGSAVNLERPLRLDGRLGGHLVQGHVDGTGTILERRPSEHWDVLRIAVPPALARYVVEKGSIAVDGVSLTVSALARVSSPGPPDWIEVSLIPETLARTTLGRKQPGETVNLEADMIAKYVERLLGAEARS